MNPEVEKNSPETSLPVRFSVPVRPPRPPHPPRPVSPAPTQIPMPENEMYQLLMHDCTIM